MLPRELEIARGERLTVRPSEVVLQGVGIGYAHVALNTFRIYVSESIADLGYDSLNCGKVFRKFSAGESLKVCKIIE